VRIFLSYHTPDRDVAIALRQNIKSAIPDSEVFLDQSNLRFGYNWQPALYEAIADSDAFLTIIGDRLGNWQTAEYYAAHDKKVNNPNSFVLLPIIVADRTRGPVPNLPGLSQLHWIENTEPTAPDVMATILRALRGSPISDPPRPWMLINPYRGLMALEEQDSDFFFGREAETQSTIESIVEHPNKVISLIGNSGVGKSSLVQAGVIAGLKRQKFSSGKAWPEKLKDSREWAFLAFRPADAPVKALVTTFVNQWFPDATDPTRFKRITEWTDRLTSEGSLAELLDATRKRYAEQGLVPPKRAFVDSRAR
jgi:Novel STAND NTPase 1/TIR domain